MTTYKLSKDGAVVKLPQGAWIPARVVNGEVVYLDEDGEHCQDLKRWLAAGGVIAPYEPTKDEQNAPILRELEANERKAIRALIDGDTARVAEWRDKQDALRARLVK